MNKFKNEKGNSLIELIMVMMLFAIFCLSTYTLIYAGSEAQQKISDNKDSQIDVRIALSYITTKLRQNDESGKIKIMKNPINGENAIVIREDYEDEYFETWIFYAGDTIYEFIGFPDELPEESLSIPIIYSPGLKYLVSYDEDLNSIDSKITYIYGGTEKEISSIIHLKTQ